MAMEADILADRHEREIVATDRRQRTERRGRERRKSGSRINARAPTHSVLRRIGLMCLGLATTVIVLTLTAASLAGIELPTEIIAFETAAWAVSILVVALGSIEQRLTEIRLELMMLNGGRRAEEDRRQASRRVST